MFERFTPKARHVVVRAQEEARGLQHNYIGTEHILLGLLGEPEGIGARVLTGLGLSLATAREEVVARVGTGKQTRDGHIPFTPRAKKVLEFALREALALHHNYIGTEHILLGLVREADGVGAQIIDAHVAEPVAARLRLAVLDLLPSEPAESGRRWFRRRGTTGAGEATEPTQLDMSPAADAALNEAARLAGTERVGSQHLVLAALADPDSAAVRTLIALGLDIDRAKDALQAANFTGTTDESPDEAGRRHLRIRVADTSVSVEVTDPVLVDLARAALDAVGDQTDEAGTIPGGLSASTSVANIWRALHDSLDDIRRRARVGSETPTPDDPPDAA